MATDTFLASFGLIGLRLLELYAIDAEQFLQQVGADLKTPDSGSRLPSQLMDKAFGIACTLIPEPAFGLRAAECWHPSNLGTLGYAWLSSGTLRTGLRRFERFSRILGTKASVFVVDAPEGLRIICDNKRGDTPTSFAMADFSLSVLVSMCRTNYGGEFKPTVVNLRRPRPENPEPYLDYFGCDVRFAAGEDSFLLSGAVVDTPLPTSIHELATTFDAILTEQLAKLTQPDLVTRCKTYLLKQMTSGEPSERRLAEAMGMSRRTQQRKLAELGLTYKGVVDETRYELALQYLRNPQRSFTEITFLLGFSEQSAFTRAFKRWNGSAPRVYRTAQFASTAAPEP